MNLSKMRATIRKILYDKHTKDKIFYWILGSATIGIIALIGFYSCVNNIDYSCTDPKYPREVVEKCHEVCSDYHYCMSNDCSDGTKLWANQTHRICDTIIIWSVFFAMSILCCMMSGIIYCRWTKYYEPLIDFNNNQNSVEMTMIQSHTVSLIEQNSTDSDSADITIML